MNDVVERLLAIAIIERLRDLPVRRELAEQTRERALAEVVPLIKVYRDGLFVPDVEARYQGKDLDEVIARGVSLLHIEYMEDNCVWIGVGMGGDRHVSITLSCKSQKIRAMVESDGIPEVEIREVRGG